VVSKSCPRARSFGICLKASKCSIGYPSTPGGGGTKPMSLDE
jgi:hypothetical protein